MSDEVSVVIGSKKYTGWESVSINKSMESICGSFDIGLINSAKTSDIYPGAVCKVLINDKPIINGYIDKRGRKIGNDGKSMTISGRDKTCDLVDCSAVKKSGSWKEVDLLTVCNDLCKQFGIKVVLDPDCTVGKKFKSVTVQDGESAFTLIERLCRQRALLPLSDDEGNLFLTVAKKDYCDDTLTGGFNIEDFEETIDYSNRFSSYTVKGQDSGGGSPWSKTSTTGCKGVAQDNVMQMLKRNRPLIIQAEENTDNALAKQRASWEAVVRFGRSLSLKCEVAGWSQTSGALWRRNSLVDLVYEELQIDGTFLIEGVGYKLDDSNGTTTSLSITHQDALTPEPQGNIGKDKKSKNPWAK